MTIEFFDRKPGEPLTKEMPGGGWLTIVGNHTPDVVRCPPEVGGGVAKVVEAYTSACVAQHLPNMQSCDHHHRHYQLDRQIQGRTVHVCECHRNGFLWYTK